MSISATQIDPASPTELDVTTTEEEDSSESSSDVEMIVLPGVQNGWVFDHDIESLEELFLLVLNEKEAMANVAQFEHWTYPEWEEIFQKFWNQSRMITEDIKAKQLQQG